MRCFRRYGLAMVVVSVGGAVASAQLPPQQRFSPINQLGRSWGFGVSDGYHECPEGQCGPNKPGFLDKLNPFGDKLNPLGSTLYPNSCAVGKCAAPVGTTPAIPMTALPPTPNMYQQFAAPAENPMAGTMSAPQLPPAYPTTPTPYAAPTSPLPVPDPLPMYHSEPPQLQPETHRESPFPPANKTDENRNRSSKQESLLDEEPTPKAELVPPAPPLRKRQPGDKPLGEMPEKWSEPTDDTPKTRINFPNPPKEDDLNLLPNTPDLGPTTQYGRPNPFGTVSYPTERNHQQQRAANQRAREAGYMNYGRPSTGVPGYVSVPNPYLYNQTSSMPVNRYR